MFSWKKWQKTLASLVVLVGVGVVTYGDFATGEGVEPEVSGEDLHSEYIEQLQEVDEEEKPENEVLTKHKQSEGYDLITADYRKQKGFERLEEIRIEEERIAEEKRLEEERIAEEQRIAEEERIAEENRVIAEAQKKAEAEAKKKAEAEAQKKAEQEKQDVNTTGSQKQAPKQQEAQPKQEQAKRTDGFNFHNYHFSVGSFSGGGGEPVPKETNSVFQWTKKPSHYLVERISPAGRVIQQLGMGDTVVLNGKSYVVTNIKRKVPNDNNAMSVLNSVSADITIQTCETTKGANGASDLTLWYLHAK